MYRLSTAVANVAEMAERKGKVIRPMAQDHYIYVVLSVCRNEPVPGEEQYGPRPCKVDPVDICGVRHTVEEAEACAQSNNVDDDDNPIPLSKWTGFWDGRKTARGIHDDFMIIRTYNHPFNAI